MSCIDKDLEKMIIDAGKLVDDWQRVAREDPLNIDARREAREKAQPAASAVCSLVYTIYKQGGVAKHE